MKKSVLFIDDDLVALRLIVDTFKNTFGNEFAYHKAGSAEEAEEILVEDLAMSGTLPVMVVSDWIMPGKRGDEFLNILAKEYPEIALVMHSGLSNADLEAQLKASCNLIANLNKPWDGKQNLNQISEALHKLPLS